ncbi:hypothetical protein Pmani_033228 [Petrolisthes manimaculis]|uniref:Uncharacterized protein n=1 Tax=Petrolisthes manimaculis TaxID=1843537 RepID=A0AAE1NQ53_9EUCA|nr:hypothetical protein Pmani_033228 [Petrolisthes manimaculis]
MPAGVTWSHYLRFSCAAFLSMVAGSQLVHICYNPLEDINTMIEKEKHNLKSKFGTESQKLNDDKPSPGKEVEEEKDQGGGS